jgi:hypothetical protein
MSKMKKIVLYAQEALGLSLDEVLSMSLKELNDTLAQHESDLEGSLSEINNLVELMEAERSLFNSLDTSQQNKGK